MAYYLLERLPFGVPHVRSSMPLLAISPVGFDAAMFVEYGLDEVFAVAEQTLRKALCIIEEAEPPKAENEDGFFFKPLNDYLKMTKATFVFVTC